MGKFTSVLILLIIASILVMPSSATYSKTFVTGDSVVVNQSFVQDPTGGTSIPWMLWIISGIAGILFSTFALTRSKSQRMDYEVNIILSVIAWPFFGYFTWGGMTSVDYVAGVGATATGSGTIAMITQHILYTPWLLGWIGLAGFIAAVFITTLLVSQYNLFRDNENAESERRNNNGGEYK